MLPPFPITQQFNLNSAVELLEGVVVGFGDAISGDFQKCIKEDIDIVEKSKEAVELFM